MVVVVGILQSSDPHDSIIVGYSFSTRKIPFLLVYTNKPKLYMQSLKAKYTFAQQKGKIYLYRHAIFLIYMQRDMQVIKKKHSHLTRFL